jgi:hypothetical protein
MQVTVNLLYMRSGNLHWGQFIYLHGAPIVLFFYQ